MKKNMRSDFGNNSGLSSKQNKQINGRWSIRKMVIAGFIAQFLATFGLVGAVVWLIEQQAIQGLANELIDANSDRTYQFLSSYLAKPRQVNQANAEGFKLGIFDANNRQKLDKYLQQQQKIYGFDQLIFDPSNSGANLAVSSSNPTWSAIANSKAQPDRLLISAIQPVTNPSNQSIGVLVTDLNISKISSYLNVMRPSESGKVWIIDQTGKLVASSSEVAIHQVLNGKSSRLAATEIDDSIIKNLTRVVLTNGKADGQIEFAKISTKVEFEGRTFYLRTQIYQDKLGLKWMIVLAIPKSDVMPQFQDYNRIILFVGGIALLISLVGGYLTASWLFKPIMRMSAIIQKRINGEPLAPTEMESGNSRNDFRNDEIGDLEHSLSLMADQYQNTQQNLAIEVSDRQQNQIALEEIERRYRLLFNSKSEAVLITYLPEKGKPSQFIDANQVACESLEYSYAEMMEMTPHDIMPPDFVCNKAVMKELLENCYASQEILHQSKSGRVFPVELRLIKIEEPNSRTKVMAFARDISDRKRAEQKLIYSRDLLNAIYNESADCIFLVDPETRLIFDCNRRAIEMFEVQDKDALLGILGGSLQKYPCTVEEHSKCMEALELNNEYHNESEYVTFKCKTFWAALAIKNVQVDQTKISLVRLTDITNIKQTQLELATNNKSLIKANREAELAVKAKGNFLAMMSHEIRTPMNGVLGMAELLMMTNLCPEQREYLEVIRHSGSILLSVINDILDYSKIESGGLELEYLPTDLHDCVMGSIGLVAPQANSKKLSLSYHIDPDCPRFVAGDSTRICQILNNLLSNAIKFTAEGSVCLQLTSRAIAATPHKSTEKLLEKLSDKLGDKLKGQTDSQTQEIHFAIADTGIGIPAELQYRLFKPFSQVEAATTRQYGGTGLGLALCKQLSELMGGRIWVDSQPGQGSTFYFTIQSRIFDPEFLESQNLAANPKYEINLPVGLRILLVEDNVVNQKIILKVINRLGYAADLVVNGTEAIAAVQARTYDLVLMDLMMPEMDGLEATRQIYNLVPESQRPWIVALTASVMEGDREMCLAAGMNDYVSKPISMEAITRAISKSVQRN